MSITCSKTYADIPLAHRQPSHAGHCRLVHGHSWSVRVTFAAKTLDPHGFVVDFGNLRYLSDWIEEHLDHGIMLAREDHAGRRMVESQPDLFKVYWIDAPSCEGLAASLFQEFSRLIRAHEGDRVHIARVEVWEDPRNMTCYEPA